jgi:hypothetical protein
VERGDVREVRFLLNLLLEVGAADIDVLADAFLFCRATMTAKKDEFALTYLRELIAQEKDVLWEIGKPLIEEVQDKQSEGLQGGYELARAKHYEKKARSIHYALEKIPELAVAE